MIRDAWLVLPEVSEPARRQGRVADRGHDRPVAEIGLNGASVVAVVGELEPAGMPQHVRMNEEREFRSHARPGNHALISGYGQRRAALRVAPPIESLDAAASLEPRNHRYPRYMTWRSAPP